MVGDDLSRRKLIAAVGGAGGTGLLLGAGTASVLADEESVLESIFTAGVLDLEVEWTVAGASGSSEGTAAFAIELGRTERTGSATFTVRLPADGPNNPAYAWLGLTCPAPTDLNHALSLTLRYTCGDGGVIASGTLLEVADALRNGVPLDGDCDSTATPGDQACLPPGDTIDLRLDWALDEDYVGKAATSLTFEFVGRQCRNQDGTTNPFPRVEPCEDAPHNRYGLSYVEIFAFDEAGDCEPLGKIELEDDYCGQAGISESHIEPGTYVLYPDAGACDDDTGYDVRVTETAEKTADGETETTGIAFEVLERGTESGPTLCRVDLKGGPTTVTYDGDDLAGNATDGILYTATRVGGGS